MHNITENIYQQKANQVIDYISANLHLQLDVIAEMYLKGNYSVSCVLL